MRRQVGHEGVELKLPSSVISDSAKEYAIGIFRRRTGLKTQDSRANSVT